MRLPGWHNWLARETFKDEISRLRVRASRWAIFFHIFFNFMYIKTRWGRYDKKNYFYNNKIETKTEKKNLYFLIKNEIIIKNN